METEGVIKGIKENGMRKEDFERVMEVYQIVSEDLEQVEDNELDTSKLEIYKFYNSNETISLGSLRIANLQYVIKYNKIVAEKIHQTQELTQNLEPRINPKTPPQPRTKSRPN